MSMQMFDAVAAQVNSRDGSKDRMFKMPKGWDAEAPEGCWMADFTKGAAVDYCDGFKMFEVFEDAMDYAATLKWNKVRFDDQFKRWTVEEFDGNRG